MINERIVFTAPGVAELQPAEWRHPQAGEVLVRMMYTTISSGTERANLSGCDTVGWQSGPSVHFPRYCGYSGAGVVMEVGEGVTEFKPGDRVATSWGTHCRYLIRDVQNVHPIEDDRLTFQDAALALISTFPMAAVRKCRLEIGEPAIVMGLGVLGQLAVQLLHTGGAVPVIAVDPVAERRAIALRFGADAALDPTEPDFAERVRTITHGGAKVAIEVTGIGKGLDNALDCMAPKGRVALLGCTRDSNFTIDYYRKVHGPGITLIGAHTNARPQSESSAGWWTTHDDIMAAQRLTAAGRLRLKEIVGEVHDPEEAPEIYRRLMTERTFPVVQFDWSKRD